LPQKFFIWGLQNPPNPRLIKVRVGPCPVLINPLSQCKKKQKKAKFCISFALVLHNFCNIFEYFQTFGNFSPHPRLPSMVAALILLSGECCLLWLCYRGPIFMQKPAFLLKKAAYILCSL